MFRMANETHPANPEPMYQNLKARGGNQAVLFRDFVTKARFEQYLAENGGPIRELQGEIGLPVPEIPFQVDWNGWIPTNFRRVPVNVIPQHLRVAGAVVGVKDPGLFVATVRKNRLEQYFLVFSKNRPMHYQIHNPILDYPHDWQGMDEAEIDQEALPLWRRQNGATVLIRNPVTYRVRVHSIDGDTATLDFRGEPIPRARWEAVLPDDQYWTA